MHDLSAATPLPGACIYVLPTSLNRPEAVVYLRSLQLLITCDCIQNLVPEYLRGSPSPGCCIACVVSCSIFGISKHLRPVTTPIWWVVVVVVRHGLDPRFGGHFLASFSDITFLQSPKTRWFKFYQPDIEGIRRVFHELLALDIRTICTGHGPAALDDVQALRRTAVDAIDWTEAAARAGGPEVPRQAYKVVRSATVDRAAASSF